MFTGIISHIGRVERIEKSGDWRFTIAAEGFTADAPIGASIACSGACLTVIEKDADRFVVQVSAETLACTTLAGWKEGTRINLERALKVGDELGGHFVSGHVDGLAELKKIEKVGESSSMHFFCHSRVSGNPGQDPRLRGDDNLSLSSFIAPKGSVTLDGVSLTVNMAAGHEFSVNIIPHTLQSTTLGGLKTGDKVNLEIDIIARYLARLAQR